MKEVTHQERANGASFFNEDILLFLVEMLNEGKSELELVFRTRTLATKNIATLAAAIALSEKAKALIEKELKYVESIK